MRSSLGKSYVLHKLYVILSNQSAINMRCWWTRLICDYVNFTFLKECILLCHCNDCAKFYIPFPFLIPDFKTIIQCTTSNRSTNSTAMITTSFSQACKRNYLSCLLTCFPTFFSKLSPEPEFWTFLPQTIKVTNFDVD